MRPRVIGNENGGATEVDTAVSIEGTGAIRASDNRESISAVAINQWSRFVEWLANTPDAMTLDRYREAQGMDLDARPTFVCEGEWDSDGRPCCDGSDVALVDSITPDGTRLEALWCDECRLSAQYAGYIILRVQRVPEPMCCACGLLPVFYADRCAGCHAGDRGDRRVS